MIVVGPAMLLDAVHFIHLRLFDGSGDGIEDEGMRCLAFALGCGGDAGLQIVFKTDGGCGHDTADWARHNIMRRSRWTALRKRCTATNRDRLRDRAKAGQR